MGLHVHVWPNVNGWMVCLWRYLWPICAFVLSSNNITFLWRSMRLINVLCSGFSFLHPGDAQWITHLCVLVTVNTHFHLLFSLQINACIISIGHDGEFANLYTLWVSWPTVNLCKSTSEVYIVCILHFYLCICFILLHILNLLNVYTTKQLL